MLNKLLKKKITWIIVLLPSQSLPRFHAQTEDLYINDEQIKASNRLTFKRKLMEKIIDSLLKSLKVYIAVNF